MSGWVKAKVYDLKGSNAELIGSEEDKALKKRSAEHEPAWRGMEENEGLKIWRIEKFEVKDWPKEKYGRFYSGDSYIILHSEKLQSSGGKVEDRSHHVHFWLGNNSTEDECGTAAYKTVELDTYLDDKAIQHRECQGKMSDEFREYFDNITIDDGGIETGFTHVDVEAPLNFKDTVLMHYKKVKVDQKGNMEYRAVVMPLSKENLRFNGHVIVFSGPYIMQIKPKGQPAIDSFRPFNEFWADQKKLYPKADFKIYECLEEFQNDEETNKVFKDAPEESEFKIKLVRVSTDKTKIPFSEVPRKADTNLHTPLQDMTEDVFIMETHQGLLVYIGSRASSREKKMAINHADNYGGRKCSCSVRREGHGAITASWKKFFLALKDFHVRIPDEGLKFLEQQQQGGKRRMEEKGSLDHRM